MVMCPHCERETSDMQDKKVNGRVEAARFIRGHGYDYWVTTSEFLRCFASLVVEHVDRTRPVVFDSDAYFKCYQEAFKYAYEEMLPVRLDERVSFLLCEKILACKDADEDAPFFPLPSIIIE